MLRRLVILVIAAGIAGVFLIATDQRLLVWETKVVPGERYEVAGLGDIGKASHPSLVCRYFTGRGIATTVVAYRPGTGRDGGCPFLAANAG